MFSTLRAMMLIVAVVIVSGCDSAVDIEKFRAENCPLPHQGSLVPGDMVRIKVSDNKGQVLQTANYHRTADKLSGTLNTYFEKCGMTAIRVRVNTHGVAVEGGHWNSAKPEVLPIIEFEHFEIEPWTSEN